MTREIVTKRLWEDEVIAGSGVVTSDQIDLRLRAKNGNISLQYTLVGVAAPTITITYQVSNDGVTFVTPASANDLLTDGAVGSDLIDITAEIEFARWLKIIVTETAGNDATAFELFLAFQ